MTFTHDRSLLYSRGDRDDPRLGDVAKMVSLQEFDREKWDWAIIGLPDDRGVALNGGRPGAAEGPRSIRKWLYRHVSPGPLEIADIGDMTMSDDLDADHDRASQAIAMALGHASRVLVLGGGHDWGYSPIEALMQGGSVGFLNFDAHLDVRASKMHHSGTSYWRALESGVKGQNAFWFGVQPAATAEAHRLYVEAHGGQIEWQAASRELPPLQCDYLDISLDMDVFSMADAPGVSAPQPLGLRAADLMKPLSSALSRPEVRTFGIYETAPPLDGTGEPTSRLAAHCAWGALRAAPCSR